MDMRVQVSLLRAVYFNDAAFFGICKLKDLNHIRADRTTQGIGIKGWSLLNENGNVHAVADDI